MKKLLLFLTLISSVALGADKPVSCLGANCKVKFETRNGSNVKVSAGNFDETGKLNLSQGLGVSGFTSAGDVSLNSSYTYAGSQASPVQNTWYSVSDIGSTSFVIGSVFCSKASNDQHLAFNGVSNIGNGVAATMATSTTGAGCGLQVQFSGNTLQVRTTVTSVTEISWKVLRIRG